MLLDAPRPNLYGLQALATREVKRTLRLLNQAIWPPLVSTMLYFFIFGLGLGSQVREVGGVPYLVFLVPGLVLMNVIETSCSDSGDSLFVARFTNSVQELLVAPLSAGELVAGYVLGALVRAGLIGNAIMALAWAVTGAHPASWLAYLAWLAGVSVVFSGIGLAHGLHAKTFDQLAMPATFLITPLVFFGGVFNAVGALPARFQPIARMNPVFYLIDGFRATFTGHAEAPWALDVGVLLVCMVASLALALVLFGRGYRLRT